MIGWLALFAVCGFALTVATLALIRAVDVISDKTGLGRAFLGMILVATVTSLPEMATGITSVTFIDAPDIAVGDVVGSCVINLMLFALADAASGKVAFYGKLKASHTLSAAFSIVLLSVLAFALARPETSNFAVGHVSGYSIILALLYLCAAGMLYMVERKEAGRNERTQSEQRSLRAAIIQCAVAALFVALAGGLLAFSADKIAEASGLSASFVGVLFVAAATSLPEVIALLAAVRLKSYDLAAGNLLGSNLFNMVVLVADDIAYTRGPLFDAASPTLAFSAVIAIVMTVIFIVSRSAIRRPEARSADAWIGGALVLMFAVNSWFSFTVMDSHSS